MMHVWVIEAMISLCLTFLYCVFFFFAFYFLDCKISKSEVQLYGFHMDKAWEIPVVMVTYLIPLAPWQVWQASEGTGEQVHRRAGWAHLCQPLQHRQLQCQAWQMRNPQGDREADQTNQRARYRHSPNTLCYTGNQAGRLWQAQRTRQMCGVFVFSLMQSDSDCLCCAGRWTVVIKASTWFSSCYLFVTNPSRIIFVRKRLPNQRYIFPFCLALEITYLCSEISFKSSNTCLF